MSTPKEPEAATTAGSRPRYREEDQAQAGAAEAVQGAAPQRRLHDDGVRGGVAHPRLPARRDVGARRSCCTCTRRSGRRRCLHLEVAETKVATVMELAEKAEFPLQCTMEPADDEEGRRRRETMTIGKELETTIQLAFDEARRRRHEYVTLEHVLFAMTAGSGGCEDPQGVRAPISRSSQRSWRRSSTRPCRSCPRAPRREPQQTAAFWRALQRAAMHVQSAGKEFIDGGNLLVAFYRERDSQRCRLLKQQGVAPARRAPTTSRTGSPKDREDASLARRRARARW